LIGPDEQKGQAMLPVLFSLSSQDYGQLVI
jgi:hypothetical protein